MGNFYTSLKFKFFPASAVSCNTLISINKPNLQLPLISEDFSISAASITKQHNNSLISTIDLTNESADYATQLSASIYQPHVNVFQLTTQLQNLNLDSFISPTNLYQNSDNNITQVTTNEKLSFTTDSINFTRDSLSTPTFDNNDSLTDLHNDALEDQLPVESIPELLSDIFDPIFQKVESPQFRIISLNICGGLKSKVSVLNAFLARHNPSVCFLSETRILQQEETSLQSLFCGYTVFFNSYTNKELYQQQEFSDKISHPVIFKKGGVAMLIKDSWCSFLNGEVKQSSDKRVLTATFDFSALQITTTTQMIVCGIYAPADSISNKNIFWQQLYTNIEQWKSHHIPFVLTGDMNVHPNEELDNLYPKQNHQLPSFFETILHDTTIIDSWRYLHPKDLDYTFFRFSKNKSEQQT